MIQKIIIIVLSISYVILSCSNPKEIPVVIPEPILILGKLDDEREAFHKPADIITDSKSNIYVLDRGNHRIVKFDKEGNFLLQFGRFGQGPGEFSNPVDFDIDKNDQIYILDVSNIRIEIFNTAGKRENGFKIRGSVFAADRKLALDSKGKIYINNLYDGKLIDVYSKDGKLLESIGEFIEKSKTKENIISFDFDNKDNLYILFHSIPIIRKYDHDFNLIYEKDISQLQGVQESLKRIEEDKKISPKHFVYSLFLGIYVTPGGDYLIHSYPLYRFNTNGYLIQKINISGFSMALEGDKHLFCIDMDEEKGWIVKKLAFP